MFMSNLWAAITGYTNNLKRIFTIMEKVQNYKRRKWKFIYKEKFTKNKEVLENII